MVLGTFLRRFHGSFAGCQVCFRVFQEVPVDLIEVSKRSKKILESCQGVPGGLHVTSSDLRVVPGDLRDSSKDITWFQGSSSGS